MRAFLYTWGGGRTTAEGEHIPFRMDPIALQHAEHVSLVLPLTLEHEIDERSPLYGHTYDSLTVHLRPTLPTLPTLPHAAQCSKIEAMQPRLSPSPASKPSPRPSEATRPAACISQRACLSISAVICILGFR